MQDAVINNFLNARIDEKNKNSLRLIDLFFFAAITICAVFVRASLFTHVSSDYTQFLEEWFYTLKNNGGFSAIGMSIGDYTPPYFYLLAGLTYIPIDPLVSIKLSSCIFDFALAGCGYFLLYKHGFKTSISMLAYAALLLFPTGILNSAAWAQCDVIFTLFLLLSVASFLKDRPFVAAIFFGIAFTLKLQAIFLAPLLLLLLIKGRMKLWHFLAIPGVYLIAIIPSFIAGRSFWELLTVYVSQSGQYPRLSMNAANLWLLVGDLKNSALSMAGIFIAGAILLTSLYVLIKKKFELTPTIVISLSLFFLLLIPSVLPHMHERYFFPADVFSIVYAFFRPKRWFVPLLVTGASLLCYLPFLFGVTPVNLFIAVALMLAALVTVIFDIRNQLFQEQYQGSCKVI